MKSSLFRNTVYKIVLNACNLLIPIMVGPYISYLLDPKLYGAYNRVYAEFGFFLTFAGFGIYNYGVREISKIRNDQKKFNQVFTSLFVLGILANIFVGVIYIIYFMYRSSGIDYWIYMVMMIQIIANMFYIEFVNEAVENYGFIAKKTIIIRLMYFAAIFLFVKKPDDIIIYTIVVSVTVLLNNLVSFLYIKKKIHFDFSNLQFKVHLIPLVVTLIYSNSELLYSQLDKVMLGPFVGDISVTEYTLASTIVGMLGIIPMSLISVSIPRLSHYLGKKDMDSYNKSLLNVSESFMAVSIPMFMGVAVLAEEIMFLYTADKYTYAFPILIVSALTRIVYSYFAISGNLVMYINSMEKSLMCMSIAGGILNLVLNFMLVLFGVFTPVTAAFTTLIADLTEIVIMVLFTKKKMNVHYGFFSKKMLGYYLVSALFIPVAILIKTMSSSYIVNIILIMPLCMIIYLIYLILTKDQLLVIVCSKFKLPFFKNEIKNI